jgi:hypothetical protein
MPRRCISLLLALVGFCAVIAPAAPPAPPPPETYDVQIRYSIVAFRNERLKQYGEMTAYLKSVGFVRDPDEDVPENEPEDPKATRMRGTIPAAKARLLLSQRHIKSVLLLPKGAKLPEDKNQPVRVHLQLASGFIEGKQRILSEQTLEVLTALNFRNGYGYDHQGFTRLVGSIPVGQLDALLSDLRKLPQGEKQPPPFKNVSPILLTEVLPDLPLPSPRLAPPPVPKGQESFSPDLRELLTDAEKSAKPMRLEVILEAAPDEFDRTWQKPLIRAVAGMVIEGRLGPLVTVYGPPKDVIALATLPEVVALRLPRVARPQLQPSAEDKNDPPRALIASGVTKLHEKGCKGKGTLLAVVDGDFRGWKELVEKKQLPATTRVVDLTRERNRNLEPEPFPGDPQQTGPGALYAASVVKAAPEIDLVLIRVDPATPYMVQDVARAINGEPYRSLNLDRRVVDLENDKEILKERHKELLKERRQVFDDFSQEKEAIDRREAYRKRQAEFDADEKAYDQRVDRYLQYIKDVRDLRNVRVVATALVWNEGFPVDGSSPLSRYFDDKPFRAALWFQSAGNTRGQAWSSLFRDEDANGIMEFAAPESPLPEGSWTRELNFLDWQPAEGAAVRELPANVKIRLSVQWREAHDPEFLQTGEDAFRDPLANLRLVLVQQPDPEGKKQPADDLVIVAESVGKPQRLLNGASFGTYEQMLEFRITKPGRYALCVEGKLPESTRPRGFPTLPATRQFGELRPRLFIETLDGAGRAVFHDFTDAGSIGMPGDSHRVITVGAADLEDRPRPYSAGGPAHNLELLVKPDLLAYDQGEGTGAAMSLAAGLAAATRSANAPVEHWRKLLPVRPGGVLKLPEGWPSPRR